MTPFQFGQFIKRAIDENGLTDSEEPIDFDTWNNKAFKIVQTPPGQSVSFDGKPIPDDPNRWSIVTPENGDSWNWPEASQSAVDMARNNWHNIQDAQNTNPQLRYKLEQMRRGMQSYQEPNAPSAPAPLSPPSAPSPPQPPKFN